MLYALAVAPEKQGGNWSIGQPLRERANRLIETSAALGSMERPCGLSFFMSTITHDLPPLFELWNGTALYTLLIYNTGNFISKTSHGCLETSV